MTVIRFIVFGFAGLILFAAQAFADDKQGGNSDLKATIKPISIGNFMLSLNNATTTVRGLRVRRVE